MELTSSLFTEFTSGEEETIAGGNSVVSSSSISIAVANGSSVTTFSETEVTIDGETFTDSFFESTDPTLTIEEFLEDFNCI